jgi:hypothetical protein
MTAWVMEESRHFANGMKDQPTILKPCERAISPLSSLPRVHYTILIEGFRHVPFLGTVLTMYAEDARPLLRKQRLILALSSRRAFCGSAARFSAACALLPFTEFLTGCNEQPKKKIVRPTVQINDTDIITNTRYIGIAFVSPEQAIFATLEPPNKMPLSAQDISFIGIIAQDTLSFGCNSITPCNIARVGLFRQQNGTFRYGYEINGVKHYTSGHVLSSDYKYTTNLNLVEEGLVADPEYPQQRRFGYNFHISSGWDGSTRLQGLQSSPNYGDQLFVGVMDDNNNVRLPANKQLQLYVGVSGSEQTPSVVYKNTDETSQVSSQYSNSENRIILTLSGSY